ncbi:Glycosyl transferase group 1 [Alloalcanivorax dieselolei B5]|uniref:Glycosyl transferase group 1 n=1 Tax=Alcanivorax dieselolei (strain DSM 16502 / CGMCC 1.3690 / MCCC 1A00001 / B-5) TaxID=930169 RepID=K0C903_ALCDB|nr:glycosyltransferase [Alloalcanivorax dieselolei]AFT69994.1 Glycosyl transferase group 1 [Alloalcanivorax dieselolei B5]GGJ88500.1 glycosyl transferase [Alloalcanivorax dieselolei]
MKVVLLASASSIHTAQWANGLSRNGVEVHVVSQHPVKQFFEKSISLHIFPFRGVFGYFSMIRGAGKTIKSIKPDILNAHYASGYATTARFLNVRPWLLSVWGSDIFEFPNKSAVHRWLVRSNLRSADAIASTSQCMAREVVNLEPSLRSVHITPFGVDVSAYEKLNRAANSHKEGCGGNVTVGTVKTLEAQYGVDTLIRAFSLVYQRLMDEDPLLASRLRLRLVGDGNEKEYLMALAIELGVSEITDFVGRIPHSQVPKMLKSIDIYVALSRRESFGVAVLEAGAAGLPVVVSNVGGLPEVVIDMETGFIVPPDRPELAANVIFKLLKEPELRFEVGMKSQIYVKSNYSWDACLEKMLQTYTGVIDSCEMEGYE